MNLSKINLTSDQAKFALILEQHPQLFNIWNFEKAEYDVAAMREYLAVCSTGEKIMANFFIAVWTRDNTNGFDIFEALRLLGNKELNVIKSWVADPFWP